MIQILRSDMMPTYEYECKKCNHRFEKFQSITAEPLKTCPECSGELKRLIGLGAGIIFKGSGFYCTDYKDTKQPSSSPAQTSQCKTCPASDDNKGCPKK